MKLLPNLTRAAALVSTLALGLAAFATKNNDMLYGIAACAFIVLIAVRDYAPKGRRWQPRATALAHPPVRSRAHRFRLAA